MSMVKYRQMMLEPYSFFRIPVNATTDNGIHSDGIRMLSEVLTTNTVLTSLALGSKDNRTMKKQLSEKDRVSL